jgi:hypothetical protein
MFVPWFLTQNMLKLNHFSQLSTYVVFSIPKPDVVGLLESGSVIICKDPDPDPSTSKQKNLDKPCFLLFCDFSMTCYLFLKTDVYVRTGTYSKK